MKTSEAALFDGLTPGKEVLPSLTLEKVQRDVPFGGLRADALLDIKAGAYPQPFRFAVEAKARNSPAVLRGAIDQAKRAAAAFPGTYPMVLVPYLSRENIQELTKERVAGLDLCGNGIVIIPTAPLYIVQHSGGANPYTDRRPIGNPYAGKSALVGRWLLARGQSANLSELQAGIRAEGGDISLGLASKVVDALADELLVFKDGRRILLKDPSKLLTRLGQGWRRPEIVVKQCLRLPQGTDLPQRLLADPTLRWVVTGESSVRRHGGLVEGGPLKIAVSSLDRAAQLLGGTVERIPNFADVELIDTGDESLFFQPESDDKGVHWASLIQTWLELQAGDARQKDAAEGLRQRILANKELNDARW